MIIITGGAGFIGSFVAAALEKRGHTDIVVCDRLRSGDKWHNVAKRNLLDIIHPDNLFDYLETHAGAVEMILHLGAISATTERDADLIVETNFRLSLKLWHWCARHRVRFIYASSAATYGDGSAGFDDDFSPMALARLKPLNAYGWSKHLFDRRVMRDVAQDGIAPPQWAGLKFFNVYGPNEYHKGEQMSVVAKMYPKIMMNEPARLFKSYDRRYPDGGQSRDFVWVGDCAEVICWLIANRQVSGIFNVGTGQARSFVDLARALFTACHKPERIEFIDMPESLRNKYQYFTQSQPERLREVGYDAPFTSLEAGVDCYVKAYLAANDPFA